MSTTTITLRSGETLALETRPISNTGYQRTDVYVYPVDGGMGRYIGKLAKGAHHSGWYVGADDFGVLRDNDGAVRYFSTESDALGELVPWI